MLYSRPPTLTLRHSQTCFDYLPVRPLRPYRVEILCRCTQWMGKYSYRRLTNEGWDVGILPVVRYVCYMLGVYILTLHPSRVHGTNQLIWTQEWVLRRDFLWVSRHLLSKSVLIQEAYICQNQMEYYCFLLLGQLLSAFDCQFVAERTYGMTGLSDTLELELLHLKT